MKLLFPLALTLIAQIAFCGEGYPEVHMNYGYIPFDRSCSDLTDYQIRPAEIEELTGRVAEFQAAWNAQGPALLGAVIEETGKPFLQCEMRATMTLCHYRSMSHPLLLNMRRFLRSTGEGEPRSMSLFVGLVFHELLHTYVVDHLNKSPLAEKYSEEPGSVISHIHLNALMKMAYLKLGLQEELACIIEKDNMLGRPIYKRAWEIVNQIEGHEAFVAELKQTPSARSDIN